MRCSGIHRQIVLLLTLWLGLTVAYSVSAATYYVSPSGSDSNNGLSQITAWRTINRGDVLGVLNPGDTVLVSAGTYAQPSANGVVISNRTGTGSHPITYQAVGSVVIDQSGYSSGNSYGFYISKPGILIAGFEIKGAVHGVYLSDGANNCTIYTNVIHDARCANINASGIYVAKCDNVLVSCNLIFNIYHSSDTTWDPTGAGVRTTGSTNLRVFNNTIDGCYVGVFYYAGTGGTYGTLTVRNNIVVNSPGWGFVNPWSTNASLITASNNLIYGNTLNYGNFPAGNEEGLQPGDISGQDPCFVNRSAHDYYLSGNSPAIDAGVYVGLGYNYSAPDMGAYEYSAPPPADVANIGEMKSKGVGATVNITSAKVVTASSSTFTDGSFYIEEPSRAAGIKVVPKTTLPSVVAGDRVTLTGSIDIDASGEKLIGATSINSKSSGTQLGALGMSCKNALAGIGLQTSGLLIRTWGQVTYLAPDGSYFYVNDGSSRVVLGVKSGIRVLLNGLATSITKSISVGDYVSITGLRGFANDGTASVSAIRPRSDTDIIRVKAATEKSQAQAWINANLGPDSTTRPFTFYYNGQWFYNVMASWQFSYSATALDANRTQRTLIYTDPATGLQVRCVAIEYLDYPAVEWTVYFKNTGSSNTPILQSVESMYTTFVDNSTSGDYTVYHAQGCNATITDFQPFTAGMYIGAQVNLKSINGKSSESILPFFNIQKPDGSGVAVAIGWTGQWQASFTRTNQKNLIAESGMIISENLWDWTHTILYPNEEIRTPSSLLVWWSGGDKAYGQNKLRSLILDHYSGVPNPPLCTAWPGDFNGRTAATETACMDALHDARHATVPVQTYVIDTGWFNDENAPYNIWEWATGNWDYDATKFPPQNGVNGLRVVSNHARAIGYNFGLWFEPERCMAIPGYETDTYLTLSSPPFTANALLKQTSISGGVDLATTRLVNLGDPQALAWLKTKISDYITTYGVDMYRQDMNCRPIYYWMNGEPSNRAGMTQIKYITGLYDYLDYLRAQHPNLIIDNCAGGGKRIDIEMLKRSFMLTRADGPDIWNPIETQCGTFGLAQWIPLTGMGGDYSTYNNRSGWGSNFYIPIDWGSIAYNNAVWSTASTNMTQMSSLKYLFTGDFYPLSTFSIDNNVWMAWQYDRSDLGEGLIQAFRRPGSTVTSNTYQLRALDASAWYLLTNIDTNVTSVVTGNQLVQFGISVSLSAGGSAAIKYRRLN